METQITPIAVVGDDAQEGQTIEWGGLTLQIVSLCPNPEGPGLVASLAFTSALETRSPLVLAYERSAVEISRLRQQVRTLTAARAKAESELELWKARCYPTQADVREAGVTEASARAVLDDVLDPVPDQGGWLDPLGDSDDLLEAYRQGDLAQWVAEAIRFCADALDLDQWALLARMAPVAVRCDGVIAELIGEVHGG